MLQDAQKFGMMWLSQLITKNGDFKDWSRNGTLCQNTERRWRNALSGTEGKPKKEWVDILNSTSEDWKEGSERISGVRPMMGRVREYQLQVQFNDARWGSGPMVAVSDGSLRGGKASFATIAVQNMKGASTSRLRGEQAIAKAELIGAWAQLKCAEKQMDVETSRSFIGFLDNEGVVKKLRKASIMTDRELHRESQGMGLYLREIRYLMRKFEGRVTWEWMKSHTDRKGWIYERHNKCDRVAGEVALDDDLDQQRFVQWNWDYILVGGGKRIEGDPRQKVRNRIAELFWTSRPSSKAPGKHDGMPCRYNSRVCLKRSSRIKETDMQRKKYWQLLKKGWD
jgi:hypothetical protein